MAAIEIDPARVRELFTYDHETGVLFWAKPQCVRIKPGQVAGGMKAKEGDEAYWVIRMDGRRYRRSRLVWAYVRGENPVAEIDHRDRDKLNDRIGNLRPATRTQNVVNRVMPKSRYPQLPRGVRPKRLHGKVIGYRGRVTINGDRREFGAYRTPDEAGMAVRMALVAAHGDQWLPT